MAFLDWISTGRARPMVAALSGSRPALSHKNSNSSTYSTIHVLALHIFQDALSTPRSDCLGPTFAETSGCNSGTDCSCFGSRCLNSCLCIGRSSWSCHIRRRSRRQHNYFTRTSNYTFFVFLNWFRGILGYKLLYRWWSPGSAAHGQAGCSWILE